MPSITSQWKKNSFVPPFFILLPSFQYYFVHQVAPTFKHRMIPFDANGEIEPAKRTLQELPPQFAKFVEKVVGLN